MSKREPRFEVVRSDAGWFARFVAANGRKVWQTEVYDRRSAAEQAVAIITDASRDPIEMRNVDERSSRPEQTVTYFTEMNPAGFILDRSLSIGNTTTAPRWTTT